MTISKSNRRGSAVIGLIVVLLLIAIVLAAKWWVKANVKDPDIVDLSPWKEWRLRESNPKPVAPPSDQQPRITEAPFFDADAKLPEDNSPRGNIRLIISPGGAVDGAWYGDYYNIREFFCDIMVGDFSGKVYPSKIYRNEEGEEDLSKLYFIAKGTFLLQVTDLRKMLKHEGGDIYVKGWLDSEYNIVGEIIITSNEKYFETFVWKARLNKRKTMGNLLFP